jgi:hypothetical protein
MVYEVKCENCGDLINFGGTDPEETLNKPPKIPENGIKFDGKVYCKECVKKFVRFGIGEVQERVEYLEEEMKEVKDALGMEKNL